MGSTICEQGFVESERHPEVRVFGEAEARGHDTNDAGRSAIYFASFPNDVRVGAKAPLPKPVAEHRHGLSGGTIVFGEKGSPECWCNSEHVEEFRGNAVAIDVFRLGVATQCEKPGTVSGQLFQRTRAVRDVRKIRVSESVRRPIRMALFELDQALRLSKRQRLEKDGVHHAKDGASCAYTQSQSQQRDEREAFVLRKSA